MAYLLTHFAAVWESKAHIDRGAPEERVAEISNLETQ
jgi:hypothetical protein